MTNKLHSGQCLICRSKNCNYAFSLAKHRVERCQDCGFMSINPQPTDKTLSQIYNSEYFVLSNDQKGVDYVSSLKQKTADLYLDIILKDYDSDSKTLLEIGCGSGDFLLQAAKKGFNVMGVEYSNHACSIARKKLKKYNSKIIEGEIYELKNTKNKFDLIVFCDVLEHVRDPRVFLTKVHSLLKEDGRVFCVVPSLDSFTAKLLKYNWVEFKLEHLSYFDSKTLPSLFSQEFFSVNKIFPAKKILSFDYISAHLEKFPIPFWTSLTLFLKKIIPKFIGKKSFPIVASGIGLIAVKTPKNIK